MQASRPKFIINNSLLINYFISSYSALCFGCLSVCELIDVTMIAFVYCVASSSVGYTTIVMQSFRHKEALHQAVRQAKYYVRI